jgi:hypothetical protein
MHLLEQLGELPNATDVEAALGGLHRVEQGKAPGTLGARPRPDVGPRRCAPRELGPLAPLLAQPAIELIAIEAQHTTPRLHGRVPVAHAKGATDHEVHPITIETSLVSAVVDVDRVVEHLGT